MARGVGAVWACAVLALVFAGWAASATQHVAFERSVRELTGRLFTISCVTPAEHGQADWAGLTELDARPHIFLSPAVCDALLHRPTTDSFDRAYAVKTLAHEAGHALLDTTCEFRAESYGMANWRRLYRVMERSSPTPAQIAYVNATHAQLPAEYRSPGAGC
jgi:hypothetical protein